MGLRYLTGTVIPSTSGSRPGARIEFREKFDDSCISGNIGSRKLQAFGAKGVFTEPPMILLGIEKIDAAVVNGRCEAEVSLVPNGVNAHEANVSWKGVVQFHFLAIGEVKDNPAPGQG